MYRRTLQTFSAALVAVLMAGVIVLAVAESRKPTYDSWPRRDLYVDNAVQLKKRAAPRPSSSFTGPPRNLGINMKTFKSRCQPRARNHTISGLHNSKTEKCCMGTIHKNPNPTVTRCCGSNIYDPSKQFCCGYKLHPRQPGHLCCESKIYDSNKAICCLNKVVEVEKEVSMFVECCGEKIYDPRTQKCCSHGSVTKVFERKENYYCCGAELYSRKTEVCCGAYYGQARYVVNKLQDTNATKCCGRTLLNPSVEKCCKGKPYNKLSQGCCKSRVYDKVGEICCQGKITKKLLSSHNSCCGKQTFNSQYQICCGENKIINKTLPEDDHCCGDISYHARTRLCCESVLFNSSNYQRMLTQSLISKPSLELEIPFDLHGLTWQCCGSQMIDLIKYPHLACCSDTKIYNRNTQLCCFDFDDTFALKIVNKIGGDVVSACCGDSAYDVQTQVCCSSDDNPPKYSIYDKLTPHGHQTGCCGLVLYNRKTQICCTDYSGNTTTRSVVYKPDAKDQDMFGVTLSFMKSQLMQQFGCCNQKAYRYSTDICCDDEIISKNGKKDCCGLKVYDVDKKMCCDNRLYSAIEGQDACCSYEATDEPDSCDIAVID